jgi:hypothetical protein
LTRCISGVTSSTRRSMVASAGLNGMTTATCGSPDCGDKVRKTIETLCYTSKCACRKCDSAGGSPDVAERRECRSRRNLGNSRIAVVMTRLRRKIKRPAFMAQRAPAGEGRRG